MRTKRKPTPAKRKVVRKPKLRADRLERCVITIDGVSGHVEARYKWANLSVEGQFSGDEDVTDWTDEEIIDNVAAMVGIEHDDDFQVVELLRE